MLPRCRTIGYHIITGGGDASPDSAGAATGGATAGAGSQAGPAGARLQQWWAKVKSTSEQIINPPLIGIFLGLLIGGTPLGRYVLPPSVLDSSTLGVPASALGSVAAAVLRPGFDAASALGTATVAIQTVVLAASLAAAVPSVPLRPSFWARKTKVSLTRLHRALEHKGKSLQPGMPGGGLSSTAFLIGSVASVAVLSASNPAEACEIAAQGGQSLSSSGAAEGADLLAGGAAAAELQSALLPLPAAARAAVATGIASSPAPTQPPPPATASALAPSEPAPLQKAQTVQSQVPAQGQDPSPAGASQGAPPAGGVPGDLLDSRALAVVCAVRLLLLPAIGAVSTLVSITPSSSPPCHPG